MTKPRRRTMLAAAMAAALAATLLAGCAALNTMPAEISTWGDWPADRKPGRYAFDRLPSQAAQPEAAARLEDAIDDHMATDPKWIAPDALVEDAEHLLREHRKDQLPVLDEQRRPVGLVDVQDLLDLRV